MKTIKAIGMMTGLAVAFLIGMFIISVFWMCVSGNPDVICGLICGLLLITIWFVNGSDEEYED